MEITELRVGNLIYMNVTDGWVIRPIKVNEFLALYKHPEWAKPIPLSEEILLKVGFEKKSFYVVGVGNCLKWELDGFTLLKNLQNNFYIPTMPKNIVLETLHKLQNAYYYMNNYQELNTSGLTKND